ncbi:RabGAP/TBC [Dendrothele bispora CBS 962.96]|uniref:RabGAP/TBC n=1 Tax=Dendrothele bispora (strain CBS 962.96) TaxID=1314807 RepID=A0A4S8MV00_DENBC|nr:RabGAP/TBC [Dendrothele bispora CBS 962.96]
MSTDNVELNATSESPSTPVPRLDSLLSPQAATFPEAQETRLSLAESELSEVALDESNFSPIALSTQQNSPRTSVTSVDSQANRLRSDAIATNLPDATQTHKKSVSVTTIRSNHTFPFVSRDDRAGVSNRGSVDGQQKLQEEFERLQEEEKVGIDPSEDPENKPGSSRGVDWDFWGAVMADYQTFASERAEELAQAISKGIPDKVRGMVWQLMAASKDPELEQTYLKLLKESSPHEKAILRDLGRTFPHHDFFSDGQGIGQENLYNVLKAYSLYDTQVGYCQGLPFVVAVLLLNMPDEEAFSLTIKLMQVYDLRGNFLPEMPSLALRLFQFDRLVEELLPVLHVHFLRQNIKSSMYCSQWFLTMFSYRFPLQIVYRIYDNVLASGIEAIFGYSIALLHKNEDILLNLKFDEILAFLNNKVLDRYKIESAEREDEKDVKYLIDEFVTDAGSISSQVTSFMLDSYMHEYEDKMREQHKHAVEVAELRNSNRQLSQQVKNLESTLAQLNAEHVDVLNELVKSRLRNEELEESLVRYKLLYAEAMHENEDAQSSHRISVSRTSSSSLLSGSFLKRGSGASKSSQA